MQQTGPSVTSSPIKRRSKLNLVLRPAKRPSVRMTLKVDPILFVRWTAFQASVAASTSCKRVDRHGLLGAALEAYMARHKAWDAA